MSSWPAAVSAGAAVAASGAAWFAAVNGARTLSQTRRDSINRSRPMVAAEFRDGHPARGVAYLVVRNYGPSIAQNLRVTFNPALPEPAGEEAHRSLIPFLKERYARLIPTLTPGTELSNVYFVGKDDGSGKFKNSEDAPDRVTVTLAYESSDGSPYTDTFDLDIALLAMETRVTSASSLEGQVKQGVETLKGIKSHARDIRQSLDKVAQSVSDQNQPEPPAP